MWCNGNIVILPSATLLDYYSLQFHSLLVKIFVKKIGLKFHKQTYKICSYSTFLSCLSWCKLCKQEQRMLVFVKNIQAVCNRADHHSTVHFAKLHSSYTTNVDHTLSKLQWHELQYLSLFACHTLFKTVLVHPWKLLLMELPAYSSIQWDWWPCLCTHQQWPVRVWLLWSLHRFDDGQWWSPNAL